MQPAVDPVLVGARLLLALYKLAHEPHVAAQLGRAVEGDTASTVDAITLLEEVADRGVHLHAHEKQRDCVERVDKCTYFLPDEAYRVGLVVLFQHEGAEHSVGNRMRRAHDPHAESLDQGTHDGDLERHGWQLVSAASWARRSDGIRVPSAEDVRLDTFVCQIERTEAPDEQNMQTNRL